MSIQALEASSYCLMYYAAFRLLTRVFTDARFKAKFSITFGTGSGVACKSVSALFGIATSMCGVYIFNNIFNNEPVGFLVDRIFIFSMSYFLYDVYAMYFVYMSNQGETSSKGEVEKANFGSFIRANSLITVHHLVIALFFIPLMSRCRNHEPGDMMIAAALVMEASTPFVSLRSILSDLGMKKTLCYFVNGIVMVSVFFLCRIVIYFAFYVVYSSQRGIGVGEALQRTPRHCIVFLLMTFLPQLYWFKIMAHGALKVFRSDMKQSLP